MNSTGEYINMLGGAAIYCIMQIVHSGKLLQLQCLVEIHGKTFMIVLLVQYLFIEIH